MVSSIYVVNCLPVRSAYLHDDMLQAKSFWSFFSSPYDVARVAAPDKSGWWL